MDILAWILFALAELRIWGQRKADARARIADELMDLALVVDDVASTYQESRQRSSDREILRLKLSSQCEHFAKIFGALVGCRQSVFWDIPQEEISGSFETVRRVLLLPSALFKFLYEDLVGVEPNPLSSYERKTLQELADAANDLRAISTKLRMSSNTV